MSRDDGHAERKEATHSILLASSRPRRARRASSGPNSWCSTPRHCANELFLGVTLSCTSPSGRVTSAEAGRNVWPAAVLQHPCRLLLRHRRRRHALVPGDGDDVRPRQLQLPTGKGVVRIVTQEMDPRSYSLLYISTALRRGRRVTAPRPRQGPGGEPGRTTRSSRHST